MPKQFVDYDNAYSLISGIAEKIASIALVIANPSGVITTQSLHSLKVGNICYDAFPITPNATNLGATNNNLKAIAIDGTLYNVNNLLIENQTLNFNEKTATISNASIKATSKIRIYYKDASLAEARRCGIVADGGNGIITFTAKQAPTTSIQCDIVVERLGTNQIA